MLNVLGRLLTWRCYNRPIFVAGVGRSGTSALVGALGKHPNILSMPDECPFINHITCLLRLYEFADLKDSYIRHLQISKRHLYSNIRRLCFETASGRFYGLKTVAKRLARGDVHVLNKQYWCAKTFPDSEAWEALVTLYPRAKVINIMRNGIDVVESRTRHQGFARYQFAEQCQAWADSVAKYSYTTTNKAAMQVRHEALVSDPRGEMRRIYDFIGVRFHERPIHFLETTLVHPLGRKTERGVDVKGVLSSRNGAYENWSQEQRKTFREICGPAMGKAGYDIPLS